MAEESYIQMPEDGSGKKVRSRKRTVGANEVFEEYQLSLPDSLICDEKNVATAGTPVPLASSSVLMIGVFVIAKETNTGTIKVGNAAKQLIPLEAGEGIPIAIDDPAKVYIDTTVNGEGVVFIAG